MGSQFDNDLSAGAVGTHMSYFGQTGTYTPVGGVAVALSGMVSNRRKRYEHTETGRELVTEADLIVEATEAFTAAITAPGGGVITLGGETWQVAGAPEITGAYLHMSVIQRTRSHVNAGSFWK